MGPAKSVRSSLLNKKIMGDFTAYPWDFSIDNGMHNVLQLFIDTGGSGLLVHIPTPQVVALPDPSGGNNLNINGYVVDVTNWDTSDVNPFGTTVQGYTIWIYVVLNSKYGPTASSGTYTAASWSYTYTNGILKLNFGSGNCEYIPKARLKMRIDAFDTGTTLFWIDDVKLDYSTCTTGTHTTREVTMDEIRTLAVGV